MGGKIVAGLFYNEFHSEEYTRPGFLSADNVRVNMNPKSKILVGYGSFPRPNPTAEYSGFRRLA